MKRFLQEVMKKNNTWNIRHLVDESFFPATKRIKLKIVGFLNFLSKPNVDFKFKLCFLNFFNVGFPVMCALCHNWLIHCFYAVSLVSNLFQVLFQIVKCKWTDCNQFCIDLLLFQTWENLIIITANPYSGNPLFTGNFCVVYYLSNAFLF